jgi:hypothetical protein
MMKADGMPVDDLNRELGRLDGRVAAIESRADRFETAVNGGLAMVNKKLDDVQTTLNQGRGGLRVAHVLIALVIAIAALFAGAHIPHIP